MHFVELFSFNTRLLARKNEALALPSSVKKISFTCGSLLNNFLACSDRSLTEHIEKEFSDLAIRKWICVDKTLFIFWYNTVLPISQCFNSLFTI
jgi:hypothetical protein